MRWNKRLAAILISAAAVLATSDSACAGPFEDLFRSFKKAFQPPRKTTTSHKTTKKSGDATLPNDASTADTSGPPSGHNTRSASKATKNTKGDFPYGTPVPGKKGFVTSPFAPESGYIDVRDFPPGTPVKDPYTGKTFLTP